MDRVSIGKYFSPTVLTVKNETPNHGEHPRHRLSRMEQGMHEFAHRAEHDLCLDEAGHDRRQAAWDRFTGKGMRKIGWFESLKNTATSSSESDKILYLHGLLKIFPTSTERPSSVYPLLMDNVFHRQIESSRFKYRFYTYVRFHFRFNPAPH